MKNTGELTSITMPLVFNNGQTLDAMGNGFTCGEEVSDSGKVEMLGLKVSSALKGTCPVLP